MSAAGDVALQGMIAKLRSFGTFPEDVAKASVNRVGAAARRTAAAGTTPEGDTWKPRKRDGKPALVNAAAAVAVRALGPVVQLFLQATGTGSAKVQAIQNAKRAILPSKGGAVPEQLAKALEETARELFTKKTGGT